MVNLVDARNVFVVQKTRAPEFPNYTINLDGNIRNVNTGRYLNGSFCIFARLRREF